MIYVFKTSVKTKGQARKLKPHIDKIVQKASWNFDLDDCDKVLRIVSEENIVQPIIRELKHHQVDCEELE